MKRNAKRIGYVVAGLAVGVLLLFVLQKYAERRISSFLENGLPQTLHVEYDASRVNIIRAALSFSGLKLEYRNPETDSIVATVAIEELRMEGLNYWWLATRDSIVWREVAIVRPEGTYYVRGPADEDSSAGKPNRKFPAISIRNLLIRNGSFARMEGPDTSPVLRADSIRLDVRDLRINSRTHSQTIPFAYGELSAGLKDFAMNLGRYEVLEADNLKWDSESFQALEVALYTRLSPQELSRVIPVERDHTTLHIPEIVAYHPVIGSKDTLLSLSLDSLRIQEADLEIYRDKLVADDPEQKRMYGQMIRELPFLLTIPHLHIINGHIGYEERVTAGTGAGRITFDSLDARITNISNTYAAPEKTSVLATANFMESAPMKLDWSFDMNDTTEEFLASGTFTNFEAQSVNPFLEANMRARVSGFVDRLYFTIGGNEVASFGDMRMKYEDFDFVILKEDRSGINKVLTFLGKVFVGKKEDSHKEGFRYGAIEAERDPTKSFFNYLWLNVRSGLKNTITGKGEKE